MNTLNLVLFNLKINKKKILYWTVAIFVITFFYMVLFPSMKDVAQLKLDAMPKNVLEFVGMSEMSEMSNFVSYSGVIYQLLIVVMSVYLASFAASLLAKEEKDNTIEYLYSLQVSRNEIYYSKVLTALIALYLFIIAAALAIICCGFYNAGETFILTDVILIIKTASITPFVFLALGCFCAALSPNLASTAIAISAFSYLIGYLAKIGPEATEFLEYISPYELFSSKNALVTSSETMFCLCVYSLISIVLIVAGGFYYNKRDFKI